MVRRLLLGVALAAGCGSGGGFPDAAPDVSPPGPGFFKVDWVVTDANSQPLDCSRISAAAVTATLRKHGTAGGSTQVFTCATGTGKSQAVEAGTYDITWELDSTQSLVLDTASPQKDVVIEDGQTTQLTSLAFSVDATGNVKLHLDALKPGGNCGTGADGAKIDAMTMTVQHNSSGPCEPVMFAVAAGATKPASTFAVDCSMATTSIPCIEHDQELSATAVPSDKYTFRVHGTVVGADCWSNNNQLTVPPLGGTLNQTLNLGHADGAPGC